MNWGTKLAIGMATFIFFILTLCFFMYNDKKDDLVENNYYEKGLNYDADYQKKEQLKIDNAEPKIEITPQLLRITFQHQAIGTIKFIRNTDKSMDKKIEISINEAHQMEIPIADISKGQWRLVMDWSANEKSYLFEKEIIIK